MFAPRKVPLQTNPGRKCYDTLIIIVDKAIMVMKLLCFMFSSIFLSVLFVGLDHAQNTKYIEMQMRNTEASSRSFGVTRKTKQCARSHFIQQ